MRVNILLDDNDGKKLCAVARSQRLRPGAYARIAVMHEVDRVFGEGARVEGFEQLAMFSKKRGSK